MATTFTPPTLDAASVKAALAAQSKKSTNTGSDFAFHNLNYGDGNSLLIGYWTTQNKDNLLAKYNIPGLNLKSVNANIVTGAALFGINKYVIDGSRVEYLGDMNKAAKQAGIETKGKSKKQIYEELNQKGKGLYAVVSRGGNTKNHFTSLYREEGNTLVPVKNFDGSYASQEFNSDWKRKTETITEQIVNSPIVRLYAGIVTGGMSLTTQLATNALFDIAQGKSSQDVIRGIVGTVAANEVVGVLKGINQQIAGVGPQFFKDDVVSALANAERQAVYALATNQDVGTAALAGAAGGGAASLSSLLTDDKLLQQAAGEFVKSLASGTNLQIALNDALSGYLLDSALAKDEAEKAIKKQVAADIENIEFSKLSDSQAEFLKNTYVQLVGSDIDGRTVMAAEMSAAPSEDWPKIFPEADFRYDPAGKVGNVFQVTNNQGEAILAREITNPDGVKFYFYYNNATGETGVSQYVLGSGKTLEEQFSINVDAQIPETKLLNLINSGANLSTGNVSVGGGNNVTSNIADVIINSGNVVSDVSNVATGNVTTGNVSTDNVSTGNVSIDGGNTTSDVINLINSGANVSTGNVSLDNVSTSNVSTGNVATGNVNVTSDVINLISSGGNVSSNVGNVTIDNGNVASNISDVGNVTLTGGNVVSNVGNVTLDAGNVVSNVSNVTVEAGNTTSDLLNLIATGSNVTIDAGNVASNVANVTSNVSDVISDTGNVTTDAGNVVITGGNVAANVTNTTSDLINLINSGANVTNDVGNVTLTGGNVTSNVVDEISNVGNVTIADANVTSNLGNVTLTTGNTTADLINLINSGSNVSNVVIDSGNVTSNVSNVASNVVIDSGNVTSNLANVVIDSGNVASNLSNVIIDSGNVVSNLSNVVITGGNTTADLINLINSEGNVTLDSGNVASNVVIDSGNVTSNLSNVVIDSGNVAANVSNVVVDSGNVASNVSNVVVSGVDTNVANVTTGNVSTGNVNVTSDLINLIYSGGNVSTGNAVVSDGGTNTENVTSNVVVSGGDINTTNLVSNVVVSDGVSNVSNVSTGNVTIDSGNTTAELINLINSGGNVSTGNVTTDNVITDNVTSNVVVSGGETNVSNVSTGNVSTGNVLISGGGTNNANASVENVSSNVSTPRNNTILLSLLNQPINREILPMRTPSQTNASPGSAALAQALRIGDAGAPVFGGDKEKSKRSGWNVESLRYMGNSEDK